uniref:Uncharacterized protein n=1 Tax=Nelumbo nucifera TaxID=4432 RepID=A0A822YGZ7_NELNU|nr:TPA_asm: hypothetical protein HUJ06_012315 [Nelumbo nucifera]
MLVDDQLYLSNCKIRVELAWHVLLYDVFFTFESIYIYVSILYKTNIYALVLV